MKTRLEMLARIRQLGDVLDKKESELAEICGVTPQQWSNYRSDTEHNNEMPARVALVLWDAFGIPMEWIYDGQTNRVPNPDMREKLVLANRRAAAWIASRRKPSPKGHMARIAIVALTGAIYFWLGGEGGQAWQRTSGSPIALQQEMADRLACRGEARDHVEHQFDNEDDYAAIYIGCMTEKGYLPKGNWYKP